MAKDSGPSMLTLLLLAGGGYVAYKLFIAPATTAAAASATPAPTAPSASSTSALDAMFTAMVTAATNATPPFASGTPDQWGFYFAAGNPGSTAPTPESAGWNRQSNWPTNLSAAQYWTSVAPLVAASKGLSGLGMYGTLGVLAHRRAM
jgi:hypothetical protein